MIRKCKIFADLYLISRNKCIAFEMTDNQTTGVCKVL